MLKVSRSVLNFVHNFQDVAKQNVCLMKYRVSNEKVWNLDDFWFPSGSQTLLTYCVSEMTDKI